MLHADRAADQYVEAGPGSRIDRLRWVMRHDLPASLVVFLVALPLSLGIAIASNAPVLAGLIAAIVGGIEVEPSADHRCRLVAPQPG
jgi:carbonic anhydrase